ncbi:MAG: hypothetical protein ACLP1D_07100 [Xanthobacteraceae bacterium]
MANAYWIAHVDVADPEAYALDAATEAPLARINATLASNRADAARQAKALARKATRDQP